MERNELTRLSLILTGASATTTTATRSSNLNQLLATRLRQAWPPSEVSNLPDLNAATTLAELHTVTANLALFFLSNYSSLAAASTQPQPSSSSASAPPLPFFGARDNKAISTLSAIVGRWGIATRLKDGILPASFLEKTKPSKGKKSELTAKISEIDQDEEERVLRERQVLEAGLEEVIKITLQIVLLPKGVRRDSETGQLATLVLPQLLLPLMGSLVQIVFGGHSDSVSWAKEPLNRLCQMNTPATVLSTVLALHSSASPNHSWLRPALSNILSLQLLRPGGVTSLLIVVVGDDDEVGVTKLDMLSRLLGTPARDQPGEVYFENITKQLVYVIQSAAEAAIPPSSISAPRPPPPPIPIIRAATFVLCHLISSRPSLATLIHSPFIPSPPPPGSSASTSSLELDPTSLPPHTLLRSIIVLSTIILHCPPLPGLLPLLVAPVLPLLFSLSSYLNAPPSTATILSGANFSLLKDEVTAVLETWGKAVPPTEAAAGLVKAIESVEIGDEWYSASTLEKDPDEKERGEYYWSRAEDGDVCVKWREFGQGLESGNDPTKMRLQPEGVVSWLKDVGRKELSSALFLRWLAEVQTLRGEAGIQAAKKTVLRLQLVLKMVEELGSDILQDPKEIIALISHILENDTSKAESSSQNLPPKPKPTQSKANIGLSDLKIVELDEEEESIEAEDDEPVIPGLGEDEMTITAVTLLLALLEANEDLNMETTPALSLIFTRLESFVNSPSTLIPPLAREARLVLSLRRLSAIPTGSQTSEGAPDPLAKSRATYQEALKLLQDPILPVRAQGLALLRSLVTSRDALLKTDPALLPAVLDIFVQAVEDEDSFLYLNAIQGLSTMVDGYGKQIVKRLVETYVGGRNGKVEEVGAGDKGRREVDKRLRMGETLVQVVQRAGEALAVFVDDLLPSLLLVLRTSTLPTTLRSSALTILATAMETAPVVLLPYIDTLAEACLTLLSIESRPLQPRRSEPDPTITKSPSSSRNDTEESSDSDFDEEDDEEEIDPASKGKPKRPEETPNPLTSDAKHPSLRRGALLFLGMVFRTASNLSSVESDATAQLAITLGTLRLPGGPTSARTKSTAQRLVGLETKVRARTILRYVEQTDEDSLVRHQAGEVLEELD